MIIILTGLVIGMGRLKISLYKFGKKFAFFWVFGPDLAINH